MAPRFRPSRLNTPRTWTRPFSLGRGFQRDETGSITIYSLFLMTSIMAVGGLAVDLFHYETERAKLQSTLDRAILAATSSSQTLDPTAVVLDYFDKANLSDYISADDVTVTESGSFRRVSAVARQNINTTFLQLAGVDGLTAVAASAAEESVSLTEISLVLDVSGSMRSYSSSGTRKIAELRDAATQFVNIMQCDPESPDETVNCTVDPEQVAISMVPYSEQVLVGEELLSQYNVTNEHTSSACVTFDDADFNSTGITGTQLLQRTGHFDPWRTPSYSPDNWVCQTDEWREIIPVSHDSETLRTQIAALDTDGNTSIDIGMKWGTALLDPNAQQMIDGWILATAADDSASGRPYDWTTRGISKVIVLMTDGVNTREHYLNPGYTSGLSEVWYNEQENRYSVYDAEDNLYYWVENRTSSWGWGWGWYWGWGGGSAGTWEDHPYGDEEAGDAVQLTFPELWALKPTDWYEQYSWLGDPVSTNNSTAKNARLEDICNAAKNQGILIFTIGFEVSTSSASVLQNCASSPAHYFDVDGLELTTAFHSVAREISKLRLVQ